MRLEKFPDPFFAGSEGKLLCTSALVKDTVMQTISPLIWLLLVRYVKMGINNAPVGNKPGTAWRGL